MYNPKGSFEFQNNKVQKVALKTTCPNHFQNNHQIIRRNLLAAPSLNQHLASPERMKSNKIDTNTYKFLILKFIKKQGIEEEALEESQTRQQDKICLKEVDNQSPHWVD